MNRMLLVGLCVMASGCGGVLVAPGTNEDGGAGGGGGGSGGGGGGGGSTAGLDGLNCEVAAVLTTRCTSCHGASPAGGAPYSLVSRAQLLEAAPGFPGQTKAARSLARMQAQTMPSGGGNAAAQIAALETWVTAGGPAGSCGAIDAGPAPTTCVGGTKWTFGNLESRDMNPGLTCLTCHVQLSKGPQFQFMGTVFRAAHEQDTCNAQPPAGLVVDIISPDGGVFTIPVRATSGNFISERLPNVATPYRARVRDTAGRTLTMNTAQTNGDCNTCHTEQGANGAGGRIVWPQ